MKVQRFRGFALLAVAAVLCSACTPAMQQSWNRGVEERNEQERAAQLAAYNASRILITAGDVSQRYVILGEVHADTTGTTNFGALLTDSLFRSPLAVAVQRTPVATRREMFDELRMAAWQRWGEAVTAIINATVATDSDGDVYADGLAVRFLGSD